MVTMLWLGSAGNAAADTKTWVGGGGNWHTPANWSPVGVPSATDDVVIAAGTPSISTGDAAVGSIDLTSGLSVDGRTLTVGATATSAIAATVSLTSATLRLNGTTTWSAGNIQITNAGVVENAGQLNVTGAVAVAVFGTDQGRRLR